MGYFGLNLMEIIFPLFSLLFFVFFIVIAIKGISEWGKNNRSPRLSVPAKVVAKRMNRTHHHNTASNMHTGSTSTTYYATFEFESGDRMELSMSGREYGMLVEGDTGKLTFQGTRYLGFERTI